MPALAERLAAPPLADRLALFGIQGVPDLLAYFEGPASAFASLAPGAANTDDNAFVETRVPRRLHKSTLDFARLERRLAPGTPVLPPSRGEVDAAAVAEALLARARDGAPFLLASKLERLLREHGASLPRVRRATLEARARLRDPAREAEAIAALHALAAERAGRSRAAARAGTAPRPRRAATSPAPPRPSPGPGLVRERPSDAYDAGRALHRIDPARAWTWFERIPGAERARFPRLALYAAERALALRTLAGGAGGASRRLAALSRHRGRSRVPLVNPVLERLSLALGDEARARDFAASREPRSRRPRGSGPGRWRATRRCEATPPGSTPRCASCASGRLRCERRSAPRTASEATTACRCCPSFRSGARIRPLLDRRESQRLASGRRSAQAPIV